MTCNISYLSDYEPFDGGYVSFGQGGCKITRKGTIKTGKLEFENVYFVKDLKYNLFSVSYICDNKNSVLFTDSECIVLGRDFKFLDDANILLRTPRQHNMYFIDLNNIVPHRCLTCLVAKASADECNLWHRRLGHLNFKIMNNLVRHNLVRGLPTKCFENDHNCTACLKGKQHKASWIKREFSNARTPQQNGVAERRNRSLIEVARTMLADAKLPITFWAEAVNTACYVQNRVLVNKAHNKTPYELFNGHEEHLESTSSQPQGTRNTDAPESSGNSNPTATSTNPPDDPLETLTVETPIPTTSSPVPTICFTDSQEPLSKTIIISKRVTNQAETPSLDNILTLTNQFEDILGDTSNSEESNGVEADVSNMEITITASPNPTLKIHRDHPKSQIIGPVDTPIQTRNKSKEVGEQSFIATIYQKTDPTLLQFCIFSCFLSKVEPKKIFDALQDLSLEEGINYDEVFAPIARIEAIKLFLAYASFMGFIVYQMDVNNAFLYGTIDEEVYVMQPPGFQDPKYPARVHKVEKAIEFEALMHEKFQMSVMGELNFFLGLQILQKEDGIFLSQDKYVGDILKKFRYSVVRSLNTPMDKENPWGKDGTGKDVDLHLYRSMIGSLMYLTASRPDIMFAVCACARHQVTPKEEILSFKMRKESALDTELFENLTLMGYNISPNQKFTFQKDEPVSPMRDVSEGEACPTDFGFIADQDRATIDKSSSLPYDTAPRVTSPAAVEGSMQQTCTSMQRQHSELLVQFQAQKVEINKLNARVKILKDNQGVIGARSADDALIKRRRIDVEEGITRRVSSDTEEIRMDEGEVVVKRTSEDTEEMATVLTSMDATTVLAGGIDVPTGSDFIATTGPPVVDIHTSSDAVPTASPIVATATVVTPYSRRKGKEVMVESDTLKKQRLQEQIDAQVARELEEQQEREDKRMTKQIARDAEVERIHAEEDLQGMIDSLDRTNETIAKYLQEYQDFASELRLERRIELISNLVKYQDNYSKIYKFQSQQRRPWTKKQKDYYMTVIKNDLGWKVLVVLFIRSDGH
nr:ribonuclease H-like domain-containing protein [Tanacetum cinerariifolium]